MSEQQKNNAFGILSSLKKLIFEDTEEPAPNAVPAASPEPAKSPTTAVPDPAAQSFATPVSAAPTDVKQMKVKVLEILEKINQPGLDFFEVWNAAAELGGVNATSVKAAFTSLKYVDKSLDKAKLISSAESYVEELRKIIDKESSQKQQQKENLQQNQVTEKASLTDEIAQLEENIKTLQAKLAASQKALKEINNKYEPLLKDIDDKIAIGQTAVNEVITDIRNTINIIETNIN